MTKRCSNLGNVIVDEDMKNLFVKEVAFQKIQKLTSANLQRGKLCDTFITSKFRELFVIIYCRQNNVFKIFGYSDFE